MNDEAMWTCEDTLQGHDAPIFMSQSHETCHIVAHSPMRPALKLYRLPHAPQRHVQARTPAATYSMHTHSHTDMPCSGCISNDAPGAAVNMWACLSSPTCDQAHAQAWTHLERCAHSSQTCVMHPPVPAGAWTCMQLHTDVPSVKPLCMCINSHVHACHLDATCVCTLHSPHQLCVNSREPPHTRAQQE